MWRKELGPSLISRWTASMTTTFSLPFLCTVGVPPAASFKTCPMVTQGCVKFSQLHVLTFKLYAQNQKINQTIYSLYNVLYLYRLLGLSTQRSKRSLCIRYLVTMFTVQWHLEHLAGYQSCKGNARESPALWQETFLTSEVLNSQTFRCLGQVYAC